MFKNNPVLILTPSDVKKKEARMTVFLALFFQPLIAFIGYQLIFDHFEFWWAIGFSVFCIFSVMEFGKFIAGIFAERFYQGLSSAVNRFEIVGLEKYHSQMEGVARQLTFNCSLERKIKRDMIEKYQSSIFERKLNGEEYPTQQKSLEAMLDEYVIVAKKWMDLYGQLHLMVQKYRDDWNEIARQLKNSRTTRMPDQALGNWIKSYDFYGFMAIMHEANVNLNSVSNAFLSHPDSIRSGFLSLKGLEDCVENHRSQWVDFQVR